jgi:hypothetical protein
MMTPLLRSFLLLSALAVAGLPSVNAQMSLSGSTRGAFVDPGLWFTTVNNGPVTSKFQTGFPLPFLSTPSSITFTGSTFSNVHGGDALALGTVKIKNGITLFNTAVAQASMDLFLNIPAEGVANYKLTTLLFGIENTPNLILTPDVYFIGYNAPEILKLNNTLVSFAIGFTDPAFNTPPGETIKENKTGTVGLFADITFTPVPEPSSYALAASLALIGIVVVNRARRIRPIVA